MRRFALILLASAALGGTLGAQTQTQAAPPAATPAMQPIASVKQVMQSILTPQSNIMFRVEVEAPKDDDAWVAVQNATLILAETGNLLMMDGRAVKRDDWMRFAKGLRDTSVIAYKAAMAKDPDAVVAAGQLVVDTCATCHDQYLESRRLRNEQRAREEKEKADKAPQK
jgi:hypothetical protein